jgi:23S rRNA (uracil1939-C5)-methyltransferase
MIEKVASPLLLMHFGCGLATLGSLRSLWLISLRFVVRFPQMSQTNAKNVLTLEIDSLSYGPYGIGRLGGKAVMVPHTAPGDTIKAQIVESKDRFAVGEMLRLMAPSPVRQTPPCPYVGRCGGCSWQHLRYDAQLKAKQQSVEDALRRIGKLDRFELRPIIPSSNEYHYRRRIRLQVAASRKLGFYGASSHQLVEIASCAIADNHLNSVIEVLRRWLHGLPINIEHVEIVMGDEPNQLVVTAKAADEFVIQCEDACKELVSAGSGVRGLILHGRNWRKVWGEPTISIQLLSDFSLAVDADIFTQVSPDGNRRMLQELLTAADFQVGDRVLELYSGAGNFTLPIAKRVDNVVAIEGHRPSIANGKLNAQKNGINNICWICSPVPPAVAQLKKHKAKFTKIILDPPRAGAKGIERDLAALGASNIFYVSCNPTTLARDLAALAKQGYKLQMVQPIDLFPQTFHVEALAVMER